MDFLEGVMGKINQYIDTEKLFIKMNEIDFEGQKLAEKIYKVILTSCLIVAMLVSYFTQRLSHGVYIMVGGLVLSMILCVPSWGFYKKHSLKWLQHTPEHKLGQKKKTN